MEHFAQQFHSHVPQLIPGSGLYPSDAPAMPGTFCEPETRDCHIRGSNCRAVGEPATNHEKEPHQIRRDCSRIYRGGLRCLHVPACDLCSGWPPKLAHYLRWFSQQLCELPGESRPSLQKPWL